MSRWMLIVLMMLTAQVGWSARMERGPVRARSLDVANPQDENYVAANGRLAMNVTNYGYFGNDGPGQVGTLEERCYGGWAPQLEYPYGSEVQYLFQGALWIGAEVETDSGYVSRVSVGTDGWHNPSINEFHAGEGTANGIQYKSNLVGAHDCFGNDAYDPNAKANIEAIAVYTDTLTDRNFVINDPTDGPHEPLGLEITQTARLWNNPEYARFVIFEFKVKNIGSRNLRNVYLGLYTDSDVGRAGEANEHTDDISGSILVDSVQGTILGWSADNDGYPDESFGPPLVSPHAMGVAALTNQIEIGVQEFANSFNWYRPNGDISLNYGPSWADSISDDWIVTGNPEGDVEKFHLLSNRERDFDESTLYEMHEPQLDTMYACVSEGESHLWHEFEEPGPNFEEIGFDTRFLLSYGPLGEFDRFEEGKCITRLNPGEEFKFTLVLLIGEDFHDPEHPQQHDQALDSSLFDFSGLIDSYQKAKRIYDSNYEFQPMPPVPDIRIYQAMNQAVPLRWDPPGFGEIAGYLVSGKPDSGRGEEIMFTESLIQTTHFTASGLTNGSWWQFIVYAVDTDGAQVAADTTIQVGAIPNHCILSGKRIANGDSLWWTVSNDLNKTGYKLVRTSAADSVVFDNITARTYVDSNFVSGRTYSYRLYINNALGIEGPPTDSVLITPYLPDVDILVLDETRHPGPIQYQRGAASDSSIRAFYERILTATGESYDYFDTDEAPLESLEQLGHYRIVLLHHDNTAFPGRSSIQAQEHEGILKSYVEMGGKLLRGGRGIFADAGFYYQRHYDVELGTLTFDSIFVARAFNAAMPGTTTRTTGATALDTLFPTFRWDSTKTPLLRYANLSFPFLSETDLMWPNGQTHAIYTAVMHESDSTGYIDPPCAVVGPGTILFGFPLYFVPESQAQQIIETSLYILRNQVLETPEPPAEPLPTAYALKQNYPNPFNANTVIEFELPVNRSGALRIYNIRGQLVTTLVDGELSAGYHHVSFNASDLASGLYFYRLEVGSESMTKKLLLLK